MKRVYLDYAAATPMDPQVLQAMVPYFGQKFQNPSAIYGSARSVRQDIGRFRTEVAGILGARTAEIVFTAGATEANNLAIQGLMYQFPDGEVLVSAVEHESVLEPAGLFSRKLIPVDKTGRVILNKLSNLISDKTVLVSVMYVNNELGAIQPLAEIAGLIEEKLRARRQAGNDRPLYLHSDAAQAGNYLDLHVSRLGVDLLSLNGGKVYGPKQSGVLFIKAGLKLQPLIIGGGQEFNLRSGTENTAAIAGLAAALKLASEDRAAEAQRITGLRADFEDLLNQKIPSVKINGGKQRAPHIISVTFEETDNERLMMELDERGIECAIGSACSASSDEPSHILAAIGLDEAQIRSSLRFSLGKFTDKTELERTVAELVRLTGNNR